MYLLSLRLRRQAHRFVPLYLTGLLLTAQYALLLYVNSSYLKLFISERAIGLVYAAGAAVNLLLLLNASRIIRKIGAYKFLLILIIGEAVAMTGLATAGGPILIPLFFLIHIAKAHMIAYCLDIYLETLSSDNITGRIRTSYLTLINLIIALSPLLTGFLVAGGNYRYAYAVSLVLFIPIIAIVALKFRHMHVAKPEPPAKSSTIAAFLRTPSLRNIFLSRFVLDFFFSWMVVYMPIYLHDHIGFGWSTIGAIFSFMLLPFVLFEIPAGRLADLKYGEKEMLVLGFAIMGLFTLLVPFASPFAAIAFWAALLFMTRVGAALIEAMSESYFFKQVDASQEDYIGIYRTSQPLSYILGPLAATAALWFLPFPALFFILAAVVFLGLKFALALRDTK